jgi:hypothetical protein
MQRPRESIEDKLDFLQKQASELEEEMRDIEIKLASTTDPEEMYLIKLLNILT